MTSSRIGRPSVRCIAYGIRESVEPQEIRFDIGKDLAPQVTGVVGPHGISSTAADLVDIAAAVFQVERQLRGRQRTNLVSRFEITFRIRDASAWDRESRATLVKILNLMGYAVWNVELEAGLRATVPEHTLGKNSDVSQVALFSGGLDSACGALSLDHRKENTRLVSYYTGQKSLQAHLAERFGFTPPTQWRLEWQGSAGRGHSYFYRSFLFLALAAAVAESWRVRRILQFENGILASAIPPAASFAMTHHAHPQLHLYSERLFSQLFGGEWVVQNPFLNYTKRECVRRARSVSKLRDREQLLSSTQSCWFYRSNRIRGAKKQPNLACGVCVPCLIRRTAMLNEPCEYDLRKDSVRNHATKGLAFRSYYGFLARTLKCADQREFYRVLPAAGRDLVSGGSISLSDLFKLFLQFADEFMETYSVEAEQSNAD